jgi:hypothetical protein
MAYGQGGGYANGFNGVSSNPFLEGFLSLQHLKGSHQEAANQQAMQIAQQEAQRNQFELEQLREKHNADYQTGMLKHLQDQLAQQLAESQARAKDKAAYDADVVGQRAEASGRTAANATLAPTGPGGTYRGAIGLLPPDSPSAAGYAADAQGAFLSNPNATVPTGTSGVYSPSPDASMAPAVAPPPAAPSPAINPSTGFGAPGLIGPAGVAANAAMMGGQPSTNVTQGNATASSPEAMAQMQALSPGDFPAPTTPSLPAMQSPDMQALAQPSAQGDYALDQQSPGFLAAQAMKARDMVNKEARTANQGLGIANRYINADDRNKILAATLDERIANNAVVNNRLQQHDDRWNKWQGVITQIRKDAGARADTGLQNLMRNRDANTQINANRQFNSTGGQLLKEMDYYAPQEKEIATKLGAWEAMQKAYPNGVDADPSKPDPPAVVARYIAAKQGAGAADEMQSQLWSDPNYLAIQKMKAMHPTIHSDLMEGQAATAIQQRTAPNGKPITAGPFSPATGTGTSLPGAGPATINPDVTLPHEPASAYPPAKKGAAPKAVGDVAKKLGIP